MTDLDPLLASLGITDAGCVPLDGGVSSDIRLVTAGERRVVAKRALPRLRVAAVWEAPVERSGSEAAWLRYASVAVPGLAPEVLAYDGEWLVLPYVEGRPWKADLLAGRVDTSVAAALGERLGLLHRTAAATPGLADGFGNGALFDALRIDPYLRVLGHPAVDALVEGLERTTLVHGDVSPKNVLVTDAAPVLLDAECATWGDPAFDVAFLLTHLCLKAVHLPSARDALVAAAGAFVESYGGCERAAALLPALAWARIDGKSPVEYLTDAEREVVRDRATSLLGSGATLAETVEGLA